MIQIDEDFLVSVADVTRAGYCHKGAREWAMAHGITTAQWWSFIHPGLSAKMLASFNDGIANRVIETARARKRQGINFR